MTVYTITGSGGAVGGDTITDAVFLTTEDGRELLADDLEHLIVDDSETLITFDNVFALHYVIGSGVSYGGGGGVVSSGFMYEIVSTGGGVGAGGGESLISIKRGPISAIRVSCRDFRTTNYIICRQAFIPAITRCNQKITKIAAKKICVNNR